MILIARQQRRTELELASWLSAGCYSLEVFRRETVLVEILAFLAGPQEPIPGGIGGGKCIEVFDQGPCLAALHNG
jgi:hypothetical protein